MKETLVAQILAHLEAELVSLRQAVDSAEEAATHEEAKPENKYDTRGLEASYLAGAQKERVAELMSAIARMKNFPVRDFGDDDAIAASAVVEYEFEGQRLTCFLTVVGAGYELLLDGQPILAITTQSPLGKALLGKRVGDLATVRTGPSEREYSITKVS